MSRHYGRPARSLALLQASGQSTLERPLAEEAPRPDAPQNASDGPARSQVQPLKPASLHQQLRGRIAHLSSSRAAAL